MMKEHEERETAIRLAMCRAYCIASGTRLCSTTDDRFAMDMSTDDNIDKRINGASGKKDPHTVAHAWLVGQCTRRLPAVTFLICGSCSLQYLEGLQS